MQVYVLPDTKRRLELTMLILFKKDHHFVFNYQ